MKTTYHVYMLYDSQTQKNYIFDLSILLERLLSENLALKKGFKIEDDYLYLVKEDATKAPETYFFIITRDNELIKAIDANLDVEDIKKRIKKDEKIGTGSFVHLTTKLGFPMVAFTSQLLSPKIPLFWNFVNEYLSKICLAPRFQITGSSLMAEAEINELMKMDVIGKTNIEIRREHSIFQLLSQTLGNGGADDSIGSFEITIKPKPNGNIKDSISKLPEIANQQGIYKLTSRAKGELLANLTDLYIVGSGTLGDNISPKDRTVCQVRAAIGKKIQENPMLGVKIREFYSRPGNSIRIPADVEDLLRGGAKNETGGVPEKS